MLKAEVLKALKASGARVFARVILGHEGGKVIVKTIEIAKNVMKDTLDRVGDEPNLGVEVSKKGHLYFYGLRLADARAMGEAEVPPAEGEAQGPQQQQA